MSESIAYNMDCMEYMRSLPDKAFDLACVDPPYGDGKASAGGGTTDSEGVSTDTKQPSRLRFHKGRWNKYLPSENTPPPRSTKLRVGGRTYRYLPPQTEEELQEQAGHGLKNSAKKSSRGTLPQIKSISTNSFASHAIK